MEDRHRKMKRELYFLLAMFALAVAGIVALAIMDAIPMDFHNDPILTILFIIYGFVILPLAFFGFCWRMRSILLDLRKRPAEVEGLLSDKRYEVRPRGDVYYYFRIDTLGFEVECDKNEWDMVDKGDRIHAVYHRHSKYIESITVL